MPNEQTQSTVKPSLKVSLDTWAVLLGPVCRGTRPSRRHPARSVVARASLLTLGLGSRVSKPHLKLSSKRKTRFPNKADEG